MTTCGIRTVSLSLACWAASTAAQALPTVLMTEGFDNAGTPTTAGWTTSNLSSPVGSSNWGPGNDLVFAAQAGASGSYAAADYTGADVGGTLANWLISPGFDNSTAIEVTLWARAANDPGFSDQLRFGFSTAGATPASFTLGSAITISGAGWAPYSFTLPAGAAASTARFAITHVGLADSANYVGIDSVTVTAVPEPAAWLSLALGLAGLGALRRRPASR